MADQVFRVSALGALHSLLETLHISHTSCMLHSFLYVFGHGRPEDCVLCSSNACFNSLVTGMSSFRQLCSHGFWDEDSLILENDAIMECQFLSVIPIFSNMDWHFFSLLWPTNQNGGFECLHDGILFCCLL